MAKRCREPDDCGQGMVGRFRRDNGCMDPIELYSNTNAMQYLFRAIEEEANRPVSTTDRLQELLNYAMVHAEPEPDIDFE